MKVNLYFIRESPKARLYSRVRPDRIPLNEAVEESDLIWVPLSIIEHTTKNPDGHHIVQLPDWFIEKENL